MQSKISQNLKSRGKHIEKIVLAVPPPAPCHRVLHGDSEVPVSADCRHSCRRCRAAIALGNLSMNTHAVVHSAKLSVLTDYVAN